MTTNKYSPRLKYEVQARGERMAFTSKGAALAHASDLLQSKPPVPVTVVYLPSVKWS